MFKNVFTVFRAFKGRTFYSSYLYLMKSDLDSF